MPRSERPLDSAHTPLARFAADLRALRRAAGTPTYREMAARSHYSVSTLSEAAGGRRLPTLGVMRAYVTACGGDPVEWTGRWHELAAALAADAAPPDDDQPSPYAGLAAFQTEDAARFFGRETLVEEVLRRLHDRPLVAVFGASGSGKSSLLRAGVAARLPVTGVLFTPGAHPLEECAVALSRPAGVMPGTLHAEIAADRRGLLRAVRRILVGEPPDAELVLIIDQFEEVFTLTTDPAERDLFIEALCEAAADERGSCRVVLGVRADFFAHCTAQPRLAGVLADGQVIVGPMTAAELRIAIVQPAVQAGLAVETPLLGELIGAAAGQAGVLPLVSHALLETWRRRRGNTLTLDGYQAAGGLTGALQQTAEKTWAGLGPDGRRSAKQLMLRLVAAGDGTVDTKRRVAPAELGDDPELSTVVARLAAARLISVDRDGIEISHEALIRAWPRLTGWLAEDREGHRLHQELTAATDVWLAVDGDRGALLRGVRLARAQEYAERAPSSLSDRERAFLTASRVAEEAERAAARRGRTRLRRTVALLSVLLVLVVATTAYAIAAGRDAARQRNTALSEVVATRAAKSRGADPLLSARLSLAAYRVAPTTAARDGLLSAVPFPAGPRLTGHAGNINGLRFSSDGRRLLTVSHDRTARLWDVADPRRPRPAGVLTGHTGTVNDAAFRPDGRLIATASWDRTVRLWAVPAGRSPMAVLSGHTADVNAVAFSPDGRRLASVGSDRTVRLWDVSRPRLPRQLAVLRGHAKQVVTVAFRPDGAELATGSFDREIRLWPLTGKGRVRVLTGHRAGVTWVAYRPDGAELASAGQDQAARIWDVSTGRERGLLAGHSGVVRSVAYRPDGGAVVTAGEDRTARLWALTGPAAYRQTAVLEGHVQAVSSAAVHPSGRLLVTGSDDDTAALWPLPDAGWAPVGPEQAAAWICSLAGPPLSPGEWHVSFPGVRYRPPCD